MGVKWMGQGSLEMISTGQQFVKNNQEIKGMAMVIVKIQNIKVVKRNGLKK